MQFLTLGPIISWPIKKAIDLLIRFLILKNLLKLFLLVLLPSLWILILKDALIIFLLRILVLILLWKIVRLWEKTLIRMIKLCMGLIIILFLWIYHFDFYFYFFYSYFNIIFAKLFNINHILRLNFNQIMHNVN